MSDYNPNAIWTSKQKKFQQPRQWAAKPTQAAAAKPASEELSSQKALPGKFDQPPLAQPLSQPLTQPPQSRAFLWAFFIFIVLAGSGATYLFLRPSSGPRVSIEFSKLDQILVGDPFILSISFSNHSSNVLRNAALSVFLPDNVSFAGQSPSQRVMERVVGDLGPGSINKQDFNLIVTGDPASVKRIDTKLIYSTDAASKKTQFETDSRVDIIVGGPAISLNIVAPPNIFSGQDFDIAVTYNNNTAHSFKNVKLNLQYPPTFTFTRSTVPTAGSGNNAWDLGTIPAAGSASITITGNVVGPERATYGLMGNLAGEVMGGIYTLTSETTNLAIGSSPLALSLSLNKASDYIAKTGDNLDYVLAYMNSSNVTFQNVVLKATLVGDLFDFSSLRSNGSFNSITNTVTWSGANARELLSLAPGQSGSVGLQIRTKPSFPIRLLSDKNYTLKVSGRIASPTVPPGTVASSTISVATAENKMGGAIALAARGYFRDAASGILNTGPYPPKVNQATQYTIHWAITNYSTDAQNVTVSAYLQSGTTCTGQIKSNVSTAPTCNAASGLIAWTIPFIPATTGITGPPAEAIIQVINTPAINQVGSAVTLLDKTKLQGTDAFTGLPFEALVAEVTTAVPDDKTIPTSQNRVVTQ